MENWFYVSWRKFNIRLRSVIWWNRDRLTRIFFRLHLIGWHSKVSRGVRWTSISILLRAQSVSRMQRRSTRRHFRWRWLWRWISTSVCKKSRKNLNSRVSSHHTYLMHACVFKTCITRIWKFLFVEILLSYYICQPFNLFYTIFCPQFLVQIIRKIRIDIWKIMVRSKRGYRCTVSKLFVNRGNHVYIYRIP